MKSKLHMLFYVASLTICAVTIPVSTAFSGWKNVTPEAYVEYDFTGIWQYGDNLRYLSASNGYLVQNNGSLVHNNGSTTWSSIKSLTNQDLLCVWGASPFSIFTASARGELLRYDNTGWQLQNNASTLPINSIHGIAKNQGQSGQVLLAVGDDGVFVNPDCWSNDWRKRYATASSTMQGLLVASKTSAKAGGSSGQIWNGSGSPWQNWSLGSVNSNHTVNALWGLSEDNIYAVGSSGMIWRSQNNGSSWTSMESPTTKTLRAIWGIDDATIYAVGDSGTILRYDGASWTQESSPTTENLKGVTGSDADNITIVGTGVVLAKTVNSPSGVPLPMLLLQSN